MRRPALFVKLTSMVKRDNAGRRDALTAIGGLGAALLLENCGGRSRVDDYAITGAGGGPAHAPALPGTSTESAICIIDPTLTRGPFWIDEGLNRVDVTSDTHGLASPNPRPGLPLELRLTVLAYDPSACTPIAGAQVDLWHCDATGLYSDAASITPGGGIPTTVTSGQNYLRGYQITDATGTVTFKTIYPGWYSGRSIHIHVKVREFDAAHDTTTEATTQLFFDDTLSDQVMSLASPYALRPPRDTRNESDGFFINEPALLVALTPKSATFADGYIGTATVGIQIGALNTG